jgi:hypothetical protein
MLKAQLFDAGLQDLRNLIDVYMDVVQRPLLPKDPRILEKEGWHYELDKQVCSVCTEVLSMLLLMVGRLPRCPCRHGRVSVRFGAQTQFSPYSGAACLVPAAAQGNLSAQRHAQAL